MKKSLQLNNTNKFQKMDISNIENIKLFNGDIPDMLDIPDGPIAVDTETMGLSIINRRDRLCTVQLAFSNQVSYIVQFKDDYAAPNLKKLLSDTTRPKICHFARFDLIAIWTYLQIMMIPIFCTKIASKLVRTFTDHHGLKSLCQDLLGIQLNKQYTSSDWGNDILSREQQEYAACDVIYLHKLKDILVRMLIREGRLELANKIFEFLPTVVSLDTLGWEVSGLFEHR